MVSRWIFWSSVLRLSKACFKRNSSKNYVRKFWIVGKFKASGRSFSAREATNFDTQVQHSALLGNSCIRSRQRRQAYAKDCDCWALGNSRIALDVGTFESIDPVAIDKASLDLVNASCGTEICTEAHSW